MNTQHDFGTAASDEGRLASVSAHVPSSDRSAAFIERVDEYEDCGVLQTDPDARFSAVILAGLMRSAFGLEDSAEGALAHCSSKAAGIRQAEPTVIHYLRAISRIERNARLEISRRNIGVRRNSSSANDRPN